MIAMRLAALGLLPMFASLCPGQKVQLVPDISLAEVEYRDANEACLRNDPNLARDLFKVSPGEMRRRIQRAAAMRDDVIVKKETYLKLFIQRLEETRNRLTQARQGDIPIPLLKKELESQQSRILGDQERVETLLRDLPESDEYLLVRREVNVERSTLVNLQNSVALRIRSLDSMDQAQQAIRSSSAGDPLAQRLDEILKIWEEERASTVRQRSRWADLYLAMGRSLEQNGPESNGGRSGGADTPKKGKEKETPQRQPPAASGQAGASSSHPAGLAGRWIYRSQPGAWTGYGEPEEAILELREEGGALIGAYNARLPVRGGVHDVHLTLSGARRSNNSARLHWNSQTPAAEGEMELKLSADGRLFVERSLSDDSYIPRGMEVLLLQ